jgi:hypothetical protein
MIYFSIILAEIYTNTLMITSKNSCEKSNIKNHNLSIKKAMDQNICLSFYKSAQKYSNSDLSFDLKNNSELSKSPPNFHKRSFTSFFPKKYSPIICRSGFPFPRKPLTLQKFHPKPKVFLH